MLGKFFVEIAVCCCNLFLFYFYFFFYGLTSRCTCKCALYHSLVTIWQQLFAVSACPLKTKQNPQWDLLIHMQVFSNCMNTKLPKTFWATLNFVVVASKGLPIRLQAKYYAYAPCECCCSHARCGANK